MATSTNSRSSSSPGTSKQTKVVKFSRRTSSSRVVSLPQEIWLWGLSIVREMRFSFSWLLDILRKFNPINRSANVAAQKEKSETASPFNLEGQYDLLGVDVLISTADPEVEPPLVTENTYPSILGVEYPIEKISVYISNDSGAKITFEATAETINFVQVWEPLCREHNIEPRNPYNYFNLKIDPTKNKKSPEFVEDRRWINKEYDNFQLRTNGLPQVIPKRCNMYKSIVGMKEKQLLGTEDAYQPTTMATRMADGTHWPWTWYKPIHDRSQTDHAGIFQIMIKVLDLDPAMGHANKITLDFSCTNIRIPMIAYVSCEKRLAYDDNKKAGAINGLFRASAIMSNRFILDLDCDHYIYKSMAIREGICNMMDRGVYRVRYVNFSQRFKGIHPSDRYADLNAILFCRKIDVFLDYSIFLWTASPSNLEGRSNLPRVDIFISTTNPGMKPPLVTGNTILSILGVEYPFNKTTVYISNEGGAILTFEAMAKTINLAQVRAPFYREHNIEPSVQDNYFNLKKDPTKNNKRKDFVKDLHWIMREYDELNLRINGLPQVIHKRCGMYSSIGGTKEKQLSGIEGVYKRTTMATWMADGTHWPGTWYQPKHDHAKSGHAGILQIRTKALYHDLVMGYVDKNALDFSSIDIRLPIFAYVSRDKRVAYDHNKKAGAVNGLFRASAIISNGRFILNLDCDHYIYNSTGIREGICNMIDHGGVRVCNVQFPQRFERIDPFDRHANHNTIYFYGNMRALDDLQGPVYVGTGWIFQRYARYGFNPPQANDNWSIFGHNKEPAKPGYHFEHDESQRLSEHAYLVLPMNVDNSQMFAKSIAVTEYYGRPLADHNSVRNGRPPRLLLEPCLPLVAPTVAEAIDVMSCWYEDNIEWGDRVGWIYGSIKKDVITSYRMHNHGWRSNYCIKKLDAFRGTAPINLTNRLHQVLQSVIGSVETFLSKNNLLLATQPLKFLQRVAYFNIGIYPFTSIFHVVYCFLPALSLFTGQFIVQGLNIAFLIYLLSITLCLFFLSLLGLKWSSIGLEEQWRNEKFWVIDGLSAHLVTVLQGLLMIVAGSEISFTLNSKSAADDEDDLYDVKWTSLFIVPLTIIICNIVALVVGFARIVYNENPHLLGLVYGQLIALLHNSICGRGVRTIFCSRHRKKNPRKKNPKYREKTDVSFEPSKLWRNERKKQRLQCHPSTI